MMNFALTLQMAVVHADNDLDPSYVDDGSNSQPADSVDDGSNSLPSDSVDEGENTLSGADLPPEASFGIRPQELLKNIGDASGLGTAGEHPDAPPGYLQDGIPEITSPIYFALDMFRYVVSAVAMIIVIIAAVKLVSTGSEEEAKKTKETITMGVIGLLVIQVADVMVKKVFFGEQGEVFEDIATTKVSADEGVELLRGITGFVEIFIGAAAVLTIVIRGVMLIASGGDEEAITKSKRHVLYAIAGLAVVGLSEIIVRGFIFPEAGSELPSVGGGRLIIVKVTNFLAGFVSLFAFATLFYAGYKYVAAAGNEEETEKVKKTILSAVIALVLALGAFALINTLLSFGSATEVVT